MKLNLNKADSLDMFQSACRPSYGIEMTLVVLVGELHPEMERESVTQLILLDLSAAFEIIDLGILLA